MIAPAYEIGLPSVDLCSGNNNDSSRASQYPTHDPVGNATICFYDLRVENLPTEINLDLPPARPAAATLPECYAGAVLAEPPAARPETPPVPEPNQSPAEKTSETTIQYYDVLGNQFAFGAAGFQPYKLGWSS